MKHYNAPRIQLPHGRPTMHCIPLVIMHFWYPEVITGGRSHLRLGGGVTDDGVYISTHMVGVL